MLKDLVRDEDWAVRTQSERDSVRGASVKGDDFPALIHPDGRVEGVFAEVADDDAGDAAIEALNRRAQKIMRHGTRRRSFFDFERDGVGFEEAHPDGEDDFACEIVQDDDGLAGGGVHHEAPDADLDLGLGGLGVGFGLESGQVHGASVPLKERE